MGFIKAAINLAIISFLLVAAYAVYSVSPLAIHLSFFEGELKNIYRTRKPKLNYSSWTIEHTFCQTLEPTEPDFRRKT